MGRIKSKLVKRTAHNLLKEENKFNENFEANKKLIPNHSRIHSRTFQND